MTLMQTTTALKINGAPKPACVIIFLISIDYEWNCLGALYFIGKAVLRHSAEDNSFTLTAQQFSADLSL